MQTEKREDPLVELGYEIRDINKGAIMKGTIGFFIFAIGSAIIGFIMFRLMYPTGFEAQTEVKRLIPQAPNPLVQGNITAKTDIMDLRQQEEATLSAKAGWVDASKTRLHIPIERAMEIIAEKGMPTTNPSIAAVTKGHTPDPAIGEKAVPAAGVMLSKTPAPATSVVTSSNQKAAAAPAKKKN